MEKNKELRIFAEEIRVLALKEFKSLGFGHVGGSMSVIETLAVLYGDVMNIDPKNPTMKNRDWMVMSKGHAGPSVYATLALKGYYDVEEIHKLNKPYTDFPSHTDRNRTAGVDMTTGSLGQGFSTAIGATLGNKIDNLGSHTFLFVGDGECNEGQVWEGAQFAAHYKLKELVLFVDYNKRQLDGSCDEVMTHGDISKKFESFGWYAQSIDGHDIPAIREAIANAYASKDKPSCIVLNTIKGKGCTYAEPSGAHSSQPTAEQHDEAILAAEKVLAELKK